MATRPTVGGSDGTWGTELNAHLDVSLDTDGKVDDGAAQTTSAAPGADAELANKKYTDDQVGTKENTLVTQSTASIFGSWTTLDSIGGTLAKTEVYRVGSDGFLLAQDSNPTAGTAGNFYVYTDGSNPPTTARGVYRDTDGGTMNTLTIPIRKDDYWKVTWEMSVILSWLPIGTGTCVKQ